MGKTIQTLSFIALGTLLVLSFILPNTPVMWIADTSSQYNFIRGLLMLVLFMLLITHPPRNIYFRKFVGVVAVVIGGWSLIATYQNHMMFLDSLSILAASISMGIAVLEYRPLGNKQLLTAK